MRPLQLNMFTNERLSFDEALNLFIDNINSIGKSYKHWVIAWSGGKDSTTLLTLLITLLDTGQIECKPETIDVLYADTRAELLPLQVSAEKLMTQLKQRGVNVHIDMADLDKRFLVNVLGRGVSLPNNTRNRWCTRQIKIDPMNSKINELYKKYNEKMLTFIGVRQGESAIRDKRIIMSCSSNNTECGTGHLHEMINNEKSDKLSPILHFRTCTTWDWLKILAPMKKYGSWNTSLLAEAYGDYGEHSAEEKNSRTGCNACPLIKKDNALENILINPYWNYISPLRNLRIIYDEMRKPQFRLRKSGGHLILSGKLAKNQNRMGPLTLDARIYFLDKIKKIQQEINNNAILQSKSKIDLINKREEDRIIELINLKTFPKGWAGNEPLASLYFDNYYTDGTVMKSIF